ncbi:Autoinducer 2 sensor kinase/phosphatase LuxQ [Brevundimonas sp. SH203]|uniref:ATP-binding protein n=1 Tax=Brevundimonas sp. SH203 TaxID=345167 RepID=UPI0009CBAED0|nr:ATP-binding protein [Brevundimonas sp. SH203]GAW41165.1 Autoinducer 2 sensor kinase/phosphatase LuxQ [Brevundimonas sp. SH203]
MNWYARMAPHLALAARERLKQTPVRVTMGLLIAWVFWVGGLGHLVAPWLVISTAVQIYEYAAMEPYRRRPSAELEAPAYVLAALSGAGLFSVAFAIAIGVMWSQGDQVMAAIAVMAIAGTLVSNMVSGIGSQTLFLIGALPYFTTLFAMPVIAPDPRSPALPPLIGSVVLLVVAVTVIWSRLKSSRAQELAALAEAQNRLDQAQQAMADRAAMAAIVSHELRTPVSAILAGAHVIRQGRSPETTPETAQLIMDAGRLMTGMLNDLLDHSKIEARGMTLEVQDFDLSTFLTETGRFWAAAAEEKGLALHVATLSEALWLKGDPFRLRQIVNNLMSNAVKFTPRGGAVSLNVTTRTGADGRVDLVLEVADQGPGIPPDAMARLFTPFAQGSAQVARTYGGTGLGLTVSRDLARLMGGELTARSVAGEGAIFELAITLSPGVATIEHHETAATPTEQSRRLRILAVDDHEINRRTLALVLSPLDADLSMASDGLSALELLAMQAFDVVLMDVNMPGLDGNETTRRLRASGGLNAATPVIGFSAGSEAEQVAASRAAGMTDWLAKPLEPSRLYDALDRAVKG